MARQVFFSFHYARDIWRVNQVRNSGFTQQEVGFVDHSLWEQTKLKGDPALRSLIDAGLSGASVTVVLIGAETASRRWVNYEIEQSLIHRKGLLGIRINGLGSHLGTFDPPGPSPFDKFTVDDTSGDPVSLSRIVPVYSWTADGGYNNLSRWVDTAALAVGR